MNAEITIAGIPMRISFRLPETIQYFREYITQENCPDYDVRVTDEDITSYPLVCPSCVLGPYSEHYMLIARASQYLLRFNRVLFHGVAFLWHGKAWLITAPSGVGKTTQLRHWQRLYGDQIQIINGDKVVLELRPDGRTWVHPSPWTGKERDAGHCDGELAGIIILEQADHNAIRRLSARESVLRVFEQFLILGEETDEVLSVGRMEDQLLNTVPVWLLENLGDEASAVMTHSILEKYEATRYESI